MNAILGEFMCEQSKLVPISSLPGSIGVLIRKNTEINIFAREFELIHKSAWILLINSKLLVSMNSNECETDLLNIDIMNCWMSKDIVCI